METMSESRNKESLSTRVAWHSAARSAVRFWLQAMTFISNALPTRATSDPMRPNPRRPSVLSCRPTPTVVPQPPSRVRWSSAGICLSRPMISPQVSSVGPSPAPPAPPVAATTMPRSVAAATSNTALRPPVVINNRSSGSLDNTDLGNAVRSLIPATA